MRLPSKIAILLGGCAMMAATACKQVPPSTSAPAREPSPVVTAPSAAAGAAVQLPGGQTIADVAAKVTPSVVNVFSERKVARPDMSPFFADPFFQRFFGGPDGGQGRPQEMLRQSPTQRERSLGSGVIVGSDGVILTNSHVVERADKIRVALQDGRQLEAKVIGSDPQSDVAVLRVQATGLPAIAIADSSKIRIGDLVLAVGNPFGVGQTVTMGIISAVGRANMGITDYEDFIQTDAAINPGNSGGALIDMQGKLIGLNTAIASRSGGYQGIGFAIPSNMAMQVEAAILKSGKVTRGWLGVAIQEITDDLASSLKLQARHGVLVSDVSAGSPAAKAGLARGDVVTAVDGNAVNTPGHLRNAIALAGKGTQVKLDVERDGKARTVEITLGELPSDAAGGAQGGGAPDTFDEGVLGGLTVQALDRTARERLNIPERIQGVVVTAVGTDSDATEIGLRAGDVIVEANRTPTPTVDAFRKAVGDRSKVLLLVYRNGSTIYMSLSK